MIHFKKLNINAKMPVRNNYNDVGYDIFSVDDGVYLIEDGSVEFIEYNTYLSAQPVVDSYSWTHDTSRISIDHSKYLEIVPRSSISKYDLVLCNSPAIIDSTYTGPIKLRFKLLKSRESAKTYSAGDRIGQIVIRERKSDEFVEVENLIETSRGNGGFGSTGK